LFVRKGGASQKRLGNTGVKPKRGTSQCLLTYTHVLPTTEHFAEAHA